MSAADTLPRARLLEHGAKSLSESELLSVLIRGGYSAARAAEIADRFMEEFGGLEKLSTLEADHLNHLGLRPATASMVLAAFEVSRRMAEAKLRDRRVINCPEKVSSFLAQRYHLFDQEVMGALYLDVKYHLIAVEEVFRGSLAQATVEPRPILRKALLRGAGGIILWHTHPSGDATPSHEDISFTRRMAKASEILGIRLLDHLVIGTEGDWSSIHRRGWW